MSKKLKLMDLIEKSSIKYLPKQQQQVALSTQNNVLSYLVLCEEWENVLKLAYDNQWRFAGLWCESKLENNMESNLKINVESHASFNVQSSTSLATLQLTLCCVANECYVLIQTQIAYNESEIKSATTFYPASNRFERYIHDMYGVNFINSNDKRRWIRHSAWCENVFPLHPKFTDKIKNFTSNSLPDCDYPFKKIDGLGICEVPVGPVHAGIIEPGHFRFSVNGEDILHLEERLGFVHKGIEKLAENKNIDELLSLASRVSGDSTVAYAWSLCRACENNLDIAIPKRTHYIRAIMAERERIANHLGDMGALCNDVGFAFAYYQMGRLRELWQRTSHKIFKHRFMMDNIVFGGVKHDINVQDINDMQQELAWLQQELSELLSIIYNNASLQDRFVTTGILTQDKGRQLGVLGFVAKASGIDFDSRINCAYEPYDELYVKTNIKKISHNTGDVASRFAVRAEETLNSCEIIAKLLNNLPQDKIQFDLTIQEKQRILANHNGFGYVESWRGELLTYVKFNSQGLTERYFVRDPSWFNWLALEEIVHNNITPDFPVCNKSINGSYSGVDL